MYHLSRIFKWGRAKRKGAYFAERPILKSVNFLLQISQSQSHHCYKWLHLLGMASSHPATWWAHRHMHSFYLRCAPELHVPALNLPSPQHSIPKSKHKKKNGSMDEADTHGCISLTAASCYAEDASIFPMFIVGRAKINNLQSAKSIRSFLQYCQIDEGLGKMLHRKQ